MTDSVKEKRRGCVQVYTGNGKGKTTAAVGLAVRAAGAGFRVFFIQFIKGGTPSNELVSLENLGIRTLRTATQPTGLLRGGATEDDQRAALDGFRAAEQALLSKDFDLVILDELNIALHYGLLSTSEFVALCKRRTPHIEVVATGRNAPEELLAAADLITEMKDVRHPFRAGISAREGIEF